MLPKVVKLHPIKDLKGKLNHLHLLKTYVMRTIRLANSIQPIQNDKQSSLQSQTVESIQSLASPASNLSLRQFHKLQFDFQVHKENALFATPSTIFDDLSPFEQKLSIVLKKYTSQLTADQLLYLNYTLRARVNAELLNWDNLHLNIYSPSKTDILIMPQLEKVGQQFELRTAPKKTVMKHIAAIKKERIDRIQKWRINHDENA